MRKAILAAHGFVCVYCGSTADSADHIVPTKLGGKDEATNLIAACQTCNSTKGGRRLDPAIEAELQIRAWIVAPLVNELASVFAAARQEARTRKKNPIGLLGLSPA